MAGRVKSFRYCTGLPASMLFRILVSLRERVGVDLIHSVGRKFLNELQPA